MAARHNLSRCKKIWRFAITATLTHALSPRYCRTRTIVLPAATTRHTLSRQWQLLQLLPNRHPGSTCAELLARLQDAGHQTSRRTVERDLVELSQIFALQINNKGTPQGWYWPGGASLPSISLGEALTLHLAQRSLGALIPGFMLKSLEPRFLQARQKLQALNDSNAAARWVDKIASVQPQLTVKAPEVDPEHLATLQLALLNDTQVECHYYSMHRDLSRTLVLNPLGMVQRGQVTYLVATADPFEDIRLFVVHRVQAARALDTPVRKPEGFDLGHYVASGAMQFGEQQRIELRAWVDDDLARRLRETPIAEDMQLEAGDQGAQLSATVQDSWELKWWLLSQAGSIVIQQPSALREEILGRLRQALDLHL